MPVSPPTVNKNKKPKIHNWSGANNIFLPLKDTNHLNTLIPVGTAIIIVAAVKYSRVSMSNPTLNIWCAQTTQPKTPILVIAKNIPGTPNGDGFPLETITACLTNPNPGKIKIYTSGCPKNQNKCWNKIGSPPPKGSKKEVFKFRSNKSIVIPPANTGNLRTNKKAVTHTLIKNKGIDIHEIALFFKLLIVHKKLMDPTIDLTPAKCRLKITKSTLQLEWPVIPLSGG